MSTRTKELPQLPTHQEHPRSLHTKLAQEAKQQLPEPVTIETVPELYHDHTSGPEYSTDYYAPEQDPSYLGNTDNVSFYDQYTEVHHADMTPGSTMLQQSTMTIISSAPVNTTASLATSTKNNGNNYHQNNNNGNTMANCYTGMLAPTMGIPNDPNANASNSAQQSLDYYDSYEHQGYEDWQNYGYYDEAGNFIQYDPVQSSYYDESGNLVVGSQEIGQVEQQYSTDMNAMGIVGMSEDYNTSSSLLSNKTPVSAAGSNNNRVATTSASSSSTTGFISGILSGIMSSHTSTTTVTATSTTTSTTTTTMSRSIVKAVDSPSYPQVALGYADVHHEPGFQDGQYDNNNSFYTSFSEDQYFDYEGNGTEYEQYEDHQELYAGDENEELLYEPDLPHGLSLDKKDSLTFQQAEMERRMSVLENQQYEADTGIPLAHPTNNQSSLQNGVPSISLEDDGTPLSRRGSFRRQVSTRDYGYGGIDPEPVVPPVQPQMAPPQVNSISGEKTPGSILPGLTSQKPPLSQQPNVSAPNAAATAASAVANKFTSELKSAIPQFSSFTKGKSDLFSSPFSKLGSFVSNAAAKTGISANLPKDLNKTKTVPVPTNVVPAPPEIIGSQPNMPTQENYNQDPYYDYYDENFYDAQEGDPNAKIFNNHAYYEGQDGQYYDEHGILIDPETGLPQSQPPDGPVHMDSLESNASDVGARDSDDKFEAQYWQKQRERIAKQATLTTEDSRDYYDAYDNFGADKPPLLEPVDSLAAATMNPAAANELKVMDPYQKQDSIDREDEWEAELVRRGSQRAAAYAAKGKHEVSQSFDMSASLDRQMSEDYEDGYLDEEIMDETGMPIEKPNEKIMDKFDVPPGPIGKPPGAPSEDTAGAVDESSRKTSLELPPAPEKTGKSVSFDEEPPKEVKPEMQTKGMTAREKWLWAVNRICAQIVSSI